MLPTETQTPEQKKAVRAGTFSDLRAADRAVSKLLTAGFSKEQITVVCSNEAREQYFREFEHQEPAGEQADSGTAAGSALGAVAGGLVAIAVGAATGVVPLLLAGATGVAAGSGAGAFVGAMATRGGEKEVSNYYDQAVRAGQILVTVEDDSVQSASRLALAEQIISDSGAKAVALPES